MGRAPTINSHILMSENHDNRRRSKRNRLSAFDVSRFVQNSSKYTRTKKGNRMASNDQNQQGIFDLSGTINSGAINSGTNEVPMATQNAYPLNHNVPEPNEAHLRELVNESVSETRAVLNTLVQESMGRELSKIYSEIGKLNKTFQQAMQGLTGGNSNGNTQPSDSNVIQSATMAQGNFENRYSEARGTNAVPGACHIAGQPFLTRVEKLGLMFDGKPNGIDVEDFVFRLEHLRELYKIPWEEILVNFHYLVSGPANEWYWSRVRNGLITNWESLKIGLFSQYRAKRGNLELVRDIVERKQLPGETIDKFFQDLNTLRLRLEYPVSEFEMIRIAKGNLRRNIAEIVHAMPISSMEQLRIECLEVERRFPRRDMRQMGNIGNKMYRVSEAQVQVEENRDYENMTDSDEIAAINPLIMCWNCRKQGHLFRDCPAEVRSLFCYKCGHQNTTSPKCPNCNSGNIRTNGIAAGYHRSINNTATLTQQK